MKEKDEGCRTGKASTVERLREGGSCCQAIALMYWMDPLSVKTPQCHGQQGTIPGNGVTTSSANLSSGGSQQW